MTYYTIREEYLTLWTNDSAVTTETVVDGKEVSRLARAWDKDEDELIDEQLVVIEISDMTDAQLAEAIRGLDEWDPEALAELCSRAGISEEWENADGENFESVAGKAAGILGIEIA